MVEVRIVALPTRYVYLYEIVRAGGKYGR